MIDFAPEGPYPELRELRAAVQRRDWAGIAGRFGRLEDPNDFQFASRVVTDVDGCQDFLAECARRESGTLARTLHGARLITVAWDVRTSARAKNVSREQFAAFHAILRQAEQVLLAVTAEEPGNATAWVNRITINRGLELGQNEARRRYDRLSRHVPHLYSAQANVVQQFVRKWGGDADKARAFGVECMRGGPDGSLASLALLEVHLENVFDLKREERADYWRRPDVRAEVEEAAARSVRHPAFRAGYRALTAHNLFALVFHLMGEHAAARPHFAAIGEHASTFFWGYFGDQQALFQSARAKAMSA